MIVVCFGKTEDQKQKSLAFGSHSVLIYKWNTPARSADKTLSKIDGDTQRPVLKIPQLPI